MSADLNDIARRVVGWANDDEQVEVYVSRGIDTEIVVYEGEIESLSRAEALGAGVRVVKDGRQGFSYAGSLDDEILRETLAEARDNAGFATYDEFAGIAQPDGVAAVSLDLWDDLVVEFPADKKVALALDLERLAREKDARIRNVDSTEYGDGAIESAIASTSGIEAGFRRTGCYVSTSVIAGDSDETQTGGGYSVKRNPSLLDIDEAASDAVDRATRLLGASKPSTSRMTVVFDSRVTPTLIRALSAALNGESVLKGRSFFADRMGEEVAVAAFTLVDDPTNPDAYSAASYDAEGLATRRNVLIDSGRLSGFLYDSYSGRRAGTVSNGSAVRGGFKSGPSAGARAMSLAPGELDKQQIIKAVGNGVYVQSVLGAATGGINSISGDVSLGAEGLLIADGQLGAPVREFTIASTLQRMLQGVAHIGSDIEWLPGSSSGMSLAILDMSISGN